MAKNCPENSTSSYTDVDRDRPYIQLKNCLEIEVRKKKKFGAKMLNDQG